MLILSSPEPIFSCNLKNDDYRPINKLPVICVINHHVKNCLRLLKRETFRLDTIHISLCWRQPPITAAVVLLVVCLGMESCDVVRAVIYVETMNSTVMLYSVKKKIK